MPLVYIPHRPSSSSTQFFILFLGHLKFDQRFGVILMLAYDFVKSNGIIIIVTENGIVVLRSGTMLGARLSWLGNNLRELRYIMEAETEKIINIVICDKKIHESIHIKLW